MRDKTSPIAIGTTRSTSRAFFSARYSLTLQPTTATSQQFGLANEKWNRGFGCKPPKTDLNLFTHHFIRRPKRLHRRRHAAIDRRMQQHFLNFRRSGAIV